MAWSLVSSAHPLLAVPCVALMHYLACYVVRDQRHATQARVLAVMALAQVGQFQDAYKCLQDLVLGARLPNIALLGVPLFPQQVCPGTVAGRGRGGGVEVRNFPQFSAILLWSIALEGQVATRRRRCQRSTRRSATDCLGTASRVASRVRVIGCPPPPPATEIARAFWWACPMNELQICSQARGVSAPGGGRIAESPIGTSRPSGQGAPPAESRGGRSWGQHLAAEPGLLLTPPHYRGVPTPPPNPPGTPHPPHP